MTDVKSFWKRPEGTTGVAILCGMLGTMVLGIGFVLPWIIALLANTITAIALGLFLAALVSVILSRKTHIFFRSFCIWVTDKFIVPAMPESIQKATVNDLKDRLHTLGTQITDVASAIIDLRQAIAQNEKERDDSARRAKSAKETLKGTLAGRKAMRREHSNEKYKLVLTKLEVVYRVLMKSRDFIAFRVEDLEDEIQETRKLNKGVNKAVSALRTAWSALNGGSDSEQLFYAARDHLDSQRTEWLGEIDTILDMSKDVLDNFDLENMDLTEECLQRLEKWEHEGEGILLGGEKAKILALSHDPTEILDVEVFEKEKVAVR